MGWSSATLAVCAPREQLEDLWTLIAETYAEAERVLDEREQAGRSEECFCCHFLRGRCSFGARCRYSHVGPVTPEEIGHRGCHEGYLCRFGHGDTMDTFHAPMPAFDIEDRLKDYSFTARLTHHGPNYSHEDPLWLEASAALRALDGVCVQEFAPPEDERQLVEWMLCSSPALLLQSLEGPAGDRLRADQRRSARQMLAALHKAQVRVFRRRWPRGARALREAAQQACTRLPHELPASGAPASAWQALASSLAACGDAVEKFWRGCNGEGRGFQPEDEEEEERCDTFEVRDLWQRVLEAEEAVGCQMRSVAADAGAGAPAGLASPDEVAAWLAAEGFGAHAEAFRSEGIDAQALHLLTEDHLRSLGVARLGDRLRLLQAISARGPPARATDAEPAEPAERRSDAGQRAPRCFSELVRQAARLTDGAILVRHWVPGGVG